MRKFLSDLFDLHPAPFCHCYFRKKRPLWAVTSTGRRNTLIFEKDWSADYEVSSQDIFHRQAEVCFADIADPENLGDEIVMVLRDR